MPRLIIPRMIRSGTYGPLQAPDDLDPKLGMADGDTLFIEGWSGRGKTMVLRLLARKAIEKDQEGRVPIFLRAERVIGTVLRAIFDELTQATNAFQNEADLASWMNNHPTLLLIDDWHHASPSCRRQIEEFLDTLRPDRAAVAIAGAPGVPPKARRLHQIAVGRYSRDEQDAVIRAFLGGTGPDRAGWFRRSIPLDIHDLLEEPVILEKCLSLLRWSATAGLRFPVTVPELMDSLLERMLVSHDSPRERAADVAHVCARLARGPRRIARKAIVEAIQAVGLRENASTLAQDLVAIGVLRSEGTSYEFEHDLWRRSFEAKLFTDEGRWDAPEDIRRWVTSAAREELFAMLPFAAGLIHEPEAQDAFFDALLRNDLELYFRALTLRANVRSSMRPDRWAMWCLQQLFHGYVDLVALHVPSLAPYIEPWYLGVEESSAKVVLRGKFAPPSLTYSFELAGAGEADVSIHCFPSAGSPEGALIADEIMPHGDAPLTDSVPILQFAFHDGDRTVRGIDLARTFTRPGSTRLIGAKLFLDNVIESIKEKRLQAPWFMRERFGAALIEAPREGSLERWLSHTVEQVVALASRTIGDEADEVAEQDDSEVAFSAEWGTEELELVIAIGEWLKDNGLRDVSLSNLLLPGPGCKEDELLPYTIEARVARVDALCRAIADTYRFLCEGMSDSVRSSFFFAQWPCRAIAEIEMVEGDGDRDPGLSMIWEPCELWDTPPIVRVVYGRSDLIWGSYKKMMEQMRQRCAQWGRRFEYLRGRGGCGRWSFSSDAVTDFASDLLLSDFEHMRDLLQNGM